MTTSNSWATSNFFPLRTMVICEEIRNGSRGCCVVVARLLFQSNEGVDGRRSNETLWGGVELSEGDESCQVSRPGRAVYNG